MSEERETYTTTPALDLDAIEARVNAATTGPWIAGCEHDYFGGAYISTPTDCYALEDTACYVPETRFERNAQHHGQLDADAIFAAAAREDVPALVAEVRRLREFGADLEWRLTEGYREALTLFEAMKAQHYPDSEAMPNQTTAGLVLQISNMVAGLRNERAKLRADIERIGRERDDMARANVELQERLSALEDDGK